MTYPLPLADHDDSEMRAWIKRRESTERAAHILAAWDALRLRVPSLPLPVLSARTQEGAAQFSWIRNDIVVEIEVYDNGSFDWFTRNRVTDKYDGSEDPVASLPEACFEALVAMAS